MESARVTRTQSITYHSWGSRVPHLILSTSSDGTIRGWNTRSFKEVTRVIAGPSQEIFSFSFGEMISFWDWSNKKQVACLEDSHGEDVTQHQNKFISASLDGLICLYDTAGDIDDVDHLESVINVGASVGKVGIFGETYGKLWCLTQIESLSVWDWKDGTNCDHFQDARPSASDSWNQDHIVYFVDCHHGRSKSLWVIGAIK